MQARGQQPHMEVRDFHSRHYSSNVMKGAIVGRQSLEELEQLVCEKFSGIINKELQAPSFAGTLHHSQRDCVYNILSHASETSVRCSIQDVGSVQILPL